MSSPFASLDDDSPRRWCSPLAGDTRVEPILRHVVLHPATFRDHAFDAERLTRVQTTHASVPRARILPRHPPSFSLAGDERFTPASSSRRERGADHHARRGGAPRSRSLAGDGGSDEPAVAIPRRSARMVGEGPARNGGGQRISGS